MGTKSMARVTQHSKGLPEGPLHGLLLSEAARLSLRGVVKPIVQSASLPARFNPQADTASKALLKPRNGGSGCLLSDS
jgi:hypothetical protein